MMRSALVPATTAGQARRGPVGPSLPDYGTTVGWAKVPRSMIRLCSCGAVETGWPHEWHGTDCVRRTDRAA